MALKRQRVSSMSSNSRSNSSPTPSSSSSTSSGNEMDDEFLAKYPLICPVCKKIFVTPAGTLAHLGQAANCRWWLQERDLRSRRKTQKGKGKASQTGKVDNNGFDYVIDPDSTFSIGDFEDEESPGMVVEEFEEDAIFHLIPIVPPYTDLPAEPSAEISQETPNTARVPPAASSSHAKPSIKQTNITLDDDEDSRVYETNTKAGVVVAMNQSLHERWAALFKAKQKAPDRPDREGDISMEAESSSPSLYFPFASELDWRVADWFVKEDTGHSAFNRLLSIPGVAEKLGLSYRDARSIHKLIDKIPQKGGEWKSKVMRFEDRPDETFCIRYRDPIEAIRSLWLDPSLADDFVYAPSKVYSSRDTKTRKHIFSEMWTGTWWNTIQVRSSFLFKRRDSIAQVEYTFRVSFPKERPSRQS
ncbi:hypothetical protein HGRIS_003318 [Hohenbuehelia grisea]|uniref:Uncharacterized protein n=1 Tax=Hohenbuehelia grisea TaxID=104357 RepID=A0ABR3JF10_9AGAR